MTKITSFFRFVDIFVAFLLFATNFSGSLMMYPQTVILKESVLRLPLLFS